MEALAEAGFADTHQILSGEGRQAGLSIRACQHDAHQLGLLMRIEPGGASIAPAVVECPDRRHR